MLSVTVTVLEALFAVTRSIVPSPIQIGGRHRNGRISRGQRNRSVESSVPISDQEIHIGRRFIRDGEIRGCRRRSFAATIPAGPAPVVRIVVSKKSSVAIPQEDRNGAVGLVGYRQIRVAVTIKIRRGDARRTVPGSKGLLRAKSSVAIAEQNRSGVVSAVRNHQVRVGIIRDIEFGRSQSPSAAHPRSAGLV